MPQAHQSGTAQPDLQQRVQLAKTKQGCMGLSSDLSKLPDAQLCALFEGDITVASACACTWRQAICQMADLDLWLVLVRRLFLLGVLLPTPQLLSAVGKLRKREDGVANIAGKVLHELHSYVASSTGALSHLEVKESNEKPTCETAEQRSISPPAGPQGADSRHSKAQRYASNCPTAAVSLLQVVIKAPHLAELLSADDQKALSATSRDFRGLFTAQLQVVTVFCKADIEVVVQLRWPMLSLVILKHRGDGCTDSHSGTLGDAQIGFSHSNPREFASVLIVTPHKAVASDIPVGTVAAKQLAHHITVNHRSPTWLYLWKLDLPGLHSAVMTQLGEGRWVAVGHLDLARVQLTVADWLTLSQGSLPNLLALSISGCGLNADAMALLGKADWPLLSLYLSHEPTLDAVAISHLSVAKYSVTNLMLSDITITAAMAAELAKLKLPHLNSISFVAAEMTAAAVFELAKADWPVLQHLELSDSHLDASALQHLSAMPLLALKSLKLTDAHITGKGSFWIGQGSWPRLEELCLEGNLLDFAGLQEVLCGRWPSICRFCVSLDMLQMRESIVLLGLIPEEVHRAPVHVENPGADDFAAYLTFIRVVPQSDMPVWPKLHKVSARVYLPRLLGVSL